MNNMKCPFCQQELRNCCAGVIYTCSKPDSCPHEQCYGSKELWQELIRTRKALDVAVDALKYIRRTNPISFHFEAIEKALSEIIVLEQKESAFVHNKIEFPEFNDNLLEEFDKQFFENGQDDDLTETALEQKNK